MTKKMIGALVSKNMCDMLYERLKASCFHFSIIYEPDSCFLVKEIKNQIKIKIFKIDCNNDIDDFIDAFNQDEFQDISLPNITVSNYHFAFIVAKLNFLSQKNFMSVEKRIHRMMPRSYFYWMSYHSMEYEYRKFPIYGRSVLSTNSRKILVMEKANGYGDSIVTMPLLRQFAKQKQSEGYDVAFWHYYEKSYQLSDVFLHEFENALCPFYDGRKLLSQCQFNIGPYHDVYNMDSFVVSSADAKLTETAAYLKVVFPIRLNTSELNYTLLPDYVTNGLRNLQAKYKFIIGVQFDTSNNSVCTYSRFWNRGNAAAFYSLCHAQEIGVVNLAPYSGGTIACDLDVCQITVPQLFSVIRQLDMTVGIDSCCGHIAGALGVPNLTLWGKVLVGKSQRTLRMNYSLIHEKGDANLIQPDTVFQTVRQILNREILLHSELGMDCSFSPQTTIQLVFAEGDK